MASDAALSRVVELPVRVIDIVDLADGVRSLVLGHGADDGADLPAWDPGAHVDLILRDGLARPYSLCGDRRDSRRWQVAVLREPESRGGSEFIHTSLAVGDVIVAREPRNNFPLEDAREYAFIAGGIGVTPFLPMLDELERRGADWRLLYGGRRRDSMAFIAELASFGPRVTVAPEDEDGLLDVRGWLGAPRSGLAVYCCGPAGLIGAVEETCRGWPAGALHVERFRADPTALEDDDIPFEVVAAQSGVTVTVPAGVSIVEAFETVGVYIPTSCGEGTCETCICQVLDGEADHRDVTLTDQQRADGQILPCCSRSRTPVIVLDL